MARATLHPFNKVAFDPQIFDTDQGFVSVVIGGHGTTHGHGATRSYRVPAGSGRSYRAGSGRSMQFSRLR